MAISLLTTTEPSVAANTTVTVVIDTTCPNTRIEPAVAEAIPA